ncbi:hypothetical protein Lser_V15G33874 [Lactuca serriola]
MTPMAANAAWNMGEWDQMSEYVSKLDDGDESKLRSIFHQNCGECVIVKCLRTVTYMRNTAATGDGGSNGTFFRVVLLVRREKHLNMSKEQGSVWQLSLLLCWKLYFLKRQLLSLISELWSSFSLPAANRPVHGPPILHLVEQLCLALNDEFRRYLPIILLFGDGKTPHYMKVDRNKWADEDDDAGPAADLDMGGMDFSWP